MSLFNMLDIENITYLYEDGWDINIILDKLTINKGLCKPDVLEIEIYPMNIRDHVDYNATIAHELIHAIHPNISERVVEHQGILVAATNIEVLVYARSLFEVPSYNEIFSFNNPT
jgi:hypothetical protein|tara:strand:+ start:32910 stop:33254 length:345 start_codon:yes stop_codon:yes gene_type:complete